MRSLLLSLLGCLALLGVEELVHARAQTARAEKAVAAARAFEAGLSAEQRALLQLPFEDAGRANWGFVPGERKGLALGRLDERGRKAAHELLGALLSARGLAKVLGIVELENDLRALEHNDGRDPGRYWLAFYGEPGSAAWTVRFEGHHISLNLSGQQNEFAGVTPLFLGANPARTSSGVQVLRREEELARQLYLGLSEPLRARASLAGATPADVLLMPGVAGGFESAAGLPFAELAPGARSLAAELVDEIVGDLSVEAGAAARARIAATAPEKLCFAWSGTPREGEPQYWRISGPDCAFEFDNLSGGNHVHRLWRDRAHDLGGSGLLEHDRAEHRR